MKKLILLGAIIISSSSFAETLNRVTSITCFYPQSKAVRVRVKHANANDQTEHYEIHPRLSMQTSGTAFLSSVEMVKRDDGLYDVTLQDRGSIRSGRGVTSCDIESR
ncbi:MAG: hypothetical protein HOE90_21985 [Bacteriovoracaceae bacterium]|jgi:hypothetical protein|nr:hypothetical protein [Bacteriovoracaceae bacterium]